MQPFQEPETVISKHPVTVKVPNEAIIVASDTRFSEFTWQSPLEAP